jgi:dTDP-4-amino-4,6-dideoxygalactose transaminase
LHSLYQQHCGYREGQFKNAEARFAAAISLPLFPGMTSLEQDRVIDALLEIAREYRR